MQKRISHKLTPSLKYSQSHNFWLLHVKGQLLKSHTTHPEGERGRGRGFYDGELRDVISMSRLPADNPESLSIPLVPSERQPPLTFHRGIRM